MSTKTPITLTVDAIDDLIYDARTGDLEALKSDLAALSTQHSCPQAWIVASAIDSEPEEEGGSGSCLLHFPAANGNEEILNFLLGVLTQGETQLDQAQVAAVINHRNHSGNTALHWAALNTHLECVKALVGAGADITVKNDAGLDAVFLAERADWSTEEQGEEQDEDEVEVEVEAEAQGGEGDAGKMPKGRQVAEWLLGSEKGGELETGAGANAPAAAEASSQ
ncbi:hypothetical protein BDV39DRAFT_183931 [Aspergillus sergii]|uniref:Uncharacterized protein n=1 Tax=Aspergillus sergii TaxID=1034303 RepID=A0A5N6WNQ8_9EURO|nr:hypothetical protein BDV39DRAFT_183931 [Aspergillus sergii]